MDRRSRLVPLAGAGPLQVPSTDPINLGMPQGTCGAGEAAVDQFAVDQAGNVLPLAIRFVCDEGSSTFGTIAYNAEPTTPGQGYYLYAVDGSLAGFGNDDPSRRRCERDPVTDRLHASDRAAPGTSRSSPDP